MDASSGNGDNGSNRAGASASYGHESVHFGWNNDMVDEESYEAQKDSDEIGENEADGTDENETKENEASSVDLSTDEETNYFGSSDVGSYETDSYGDFVSRKTTKTTYPNGSFDLVVERPTTADIPKFRRLYVCFGALKEGFKRYCRPLFGVDGCFLKCSLKGEILLAVGRDSNNNQIFLITWAL
ncbi:hypothetical protein V6N13_091413 [Hibiscus sabdariffa]